MPSFRRVIINSFWRNKLFIRCYVSLQKNTFFGMLRNVISMFNMLVPKSWMCEVKHGDLKKLRIKKKILEDPTNQCDTWHQAHLFLVKLYQTCFSPHGADVPNQILPRLLTRCLAYYYSNLVNDYVAWGILDIMHWWPQIPPMIFFLQIFKRGALATTIGMTKPNMDGYTRIHWNLYVFIPKLASLSNFIILKVFFWKIYPWKTKISYIMLHLEIKKYQ